MWCCYASANISCYTFLKEHGFSLSLFHPMNTSKATLAGCNTIVHSLLMYLHRYDPVNVLSLLFLPMCSLLHSSHSPQWLGEIVVESCNFWSKWWLYKMQYMDRNLYPHNQDLKRQLTYRLLENPRSTLHFDVVELKCCLSCSSETCT